VDIVEFALDRQKNKTGDIWHVSVEVIFFSSDTILPLEINTLFFFMDSLLRTNIHQTRTAIFFLMYIFIVVTYSLVHAPFNKDHLHLGGTVPDVIPIFSNC
jgi:hypothetical protein